MADLHEGDILREVHDLQRKIDLLRSQLDREAWHDSLPQGDFSTLVTRVGEQLLGLPIRLVEEVLPYCLLTDLAESPAWVPGLLNLHGEMIPVLDVLARFESRERSPEVADFLVVCQVAGKRFALCVQDVGTVQRVASADVQPVPADIPHAPYLLGLVHNDAAALVLLSLSSLFVTSEVPEVDE